MESPLKYLMICAIRFGSAFYYNSSEQTKQKYVPKHIKKIGSKMNKNQHAQSEDIKNLKQLVECINLR